MSKIYTSPAYRYGEVFRSRGPAATVLHKDSLLKVRLSDIHYLGQVGVTLNSHFAQAYFTDIAAARTGDKGAVARLKAVEAPAVDYPRDRVIVLKRGSYGNLGDKSGFFEDNPDHYVVLPRDFWLMPLTMSFLQQFAGKAEANVILNRGDNLSKDGRLLAAYVSLNDLLELLPLMNASLAAHNIRVRIPSEAVLDVLLSASEYGGYHEQLELAALLTASTYDPSGVKTDEFEVELTAEAVAGRDLVARSATSPVTRRTYQAGEAHHSVLLEVVSINHGNQSRLD